MRLARRLRLSRPAYERLGGCRSCISVLLDAVVPFEQLADDRAEVILASYCPEPGQPANDEVRQCRVLTVGIAWGDLSSDSSSP
jgi:hypothetical protein